MDYESLGMAMGIGDLLRRERGEAQQLINHVASQRDTANRKVGALTRITSIQADNEAIYKEMTSVMEAENERLRDENELLRSNAMREIERRNDLLRQMVARVNELESAVKAKSERVSLLAGSRVCEIAHAEGLAAAVVHYHEAYPDAPFAQPGPKDPITGQDGPSELDGVYDRAHDAEAIRLGIKNPEPYRNRGRMDPKTGFRLTDAQAKEIEAAAPPAEDQPVMALA